METRVFIHLRARGADNPRCAKWRSHYDPKDTFRCATRHVAQTGCGGVSSRRLRALNPALGAVPLVAHRRRSMSHHVSIPAREPQHVAEVLAELMAASAIRSDRWRAPLWQRAATRTEL